MVIMNETTDPNFESSSLKSHSKSMKRWAKN